MSTHDHDDDENADDNVIDPYLWDRSGEPDAEVARLENLLAPLAHKKPWADSPAAAPVIAMAASRRTNARSIAAVGLIAALALAAGIALVIKAQHDSLIVSPRTSPTQSTVVAQNDVPPAPRSLCGEPTNGSWSFHTAGGPARCGNMEIANGWMTKDEVLETPNNATATLDVATIGTLSLEPNTKLRVLGTDGETKKLDLLHGTVHAKISAAPRLFVVKTPVADAVDLGCEYSLTVDEVGRGRLDVSYGAVSLERPSHGPTLVTQGAWCPIGAEGPGTPLANTANDSLRHAAEDLDQGDKTAFDRVVGASTKTDTLTLWHVMRRLSPEERGRAYDKLATFVAPPKGAPRDAVVRGEHDAIAAYREELSDTWFGSK